MKSALASLFLRDIKLSYRVGGSMLIGILFFVSITIVIPFGIGPNIKLLSQIGPAILWIGSLLATLLGLDRLFQIDQEDGSLDLIRISGLPLELIVLVKCAAHWVAVGIPLILVTPVLSVFLNLSLETMGILMLTLLIGTPALTLIGGTGAAITASLQKGGLIQAILIIPFSVPVLIFGVSAANSTVSDSASFLVPFLFLSALTLALTVIGPFIAALALKNALQ